MSDELERLRGIEAAAQEYVRTVDAISIGQPDYSEMIVQQDIAFYRLKAALYGVGMAIHDEGA